MDAHLRPARLYRRARYAKVMACVSLDHQVAGGIHPLRDDLLNATRGGIDRGRSLGSGRCNAEHRSILRTIIG
ncbi:MAG: hypothetical protein LW923_14780 [Betaproteobacteria bacterium]|nr:hypothetical protein [Betaproteobacteria bacterium]